MGRAVVVGGGIGGLGAALALHRVGWTVTVLEQAPELHEVGAGLSLTANAMRCLDLLGVGAQVRGDRPTPWGAARTADGCWLTRLPAAALARESVAMVGVHRAELHRVLRAALPGGVLRTGARVVDVAADPARVTHRRDGATESVEADLVVAADGLHSAVRAQLWPGATRPVYVGSTAWRGVTAARWSGEWVRGISWGRGTEFGTIPLTDGRMAWFACAGAPEGEGGADPHAEVRERFGGWHDPVPAVLDATAPDAVLRNDIHHLAPPLPSYVRGRVALLGDAAHAMAPNLGQGACLALEDAVVLAAATAEVADPREALRRYDERRRRRTQRIARLSHVAGRVGQQLEHPVAVAVRNTLMRLTPPAATVRSAEHVTDWAPPALPTVAPPG